MKKIIYAMVVLMAGLIASCSNDDIVNEGGEPSHTLTCNISVQNMYNTFGNATRVRDQFLRDGSYAVGIKLFLYNEGGNLVASDLVTSASLSSVSYEFKDLKNGKYTLVAVETLVQPDNNNKSEEWDFSGESRLNTLQLVNKDYSMSDIAAVGYVAKEITVDNADVTQVITPEAIGSVINIHYLNFANSNYEYVGFATSDVSSAYRLDPSLPRSDRFVTNLTQQGYINVRCRMAPERSADHYNIVYVLENSIKWQLSFVMPNNENKWTTYNANQGTASLEDGKTYYAGMYYYGEDIAHNSYFGNSESGFNKWKDDAEKNQPTPTPTPTPAPQNKVYPTPYTTWNGSVSNVKSYMTSNAKDYKMTYDINGNDEDGYDLTYMHNDKKIQYTYTFSSKTTGLYQVGMMLLRNETTLEQLKKDIESEGYFFVDSSDGLLMYMDKDGKTIVGLMERADYDVYSVLYISSDALGAKGMSRAVDLKTFVKANMPDVKVYSKGNMTETYYDNNKTLKSTKSMMIKK